MSETTPIVDVISDLRRRGNRLLRMADELAQEYGIDSSENRSDAVPSFAEAGQAPRGSRQQQLRAYLQEHGPRTRKQIVEDTGIPKGTIAMLLTKHCEQAGEKRWRWKDSAS